MNGLLAVIVPLGLLNGALLRIGRGIGVVAIALMVIATLVQVFYRYALNNALPWPDEAARFCMLWMMGLMAPTAFRRGGFVAIETLRHMLPRKAAQILSLILLLLSLVVLLVAAQIGWKEVTGFGGRFTTASLYVPTSLSFDSFYRVPRSWMIASLLVGIVLLLMVNVELILRNIASLFGAADRLPEIPETAYQGAE